MAGEARGEEKRMGVTERAGLEERLAGLEVAPRTAARVCWGRRATSSHRPAA
jgi:hypothetical protein